MSRIPFLVPLNFALSADGSASVQFQNSAGQIYEIHSVMQESTGAFDVTDWSNNGALNFSNATEANPMSGNVFPDVQAENSSPRMLPEPYKMDGNEIMSFTCKDTSSATNAVTIFLQGVLIDEGSLR